MIKTTHYCRDCGEILDVTIEYGDDGVSVYVKPHVCEELIPRKDILAWVESRSKHEQIHHK